MTQAPDPSPRLWTVQPIAPEMDVSVVVATKNRAALLRDMLGSIPAAMGGLNYEIIAIEGGSDDGSYELLTNTPRSRVFLEREQLGEGRHSWPELYNFGFAKAQGRWAIFASDDTVFGRQAFEQAVSQLSAAADWVGGGIFFYRNAVADPGWEVFGVDFTLGYFPLLNYGLMSLDLIRKVGGLNCDYRFYAADGDLCFKFFQAGYPLLPVAGANLIHNNVLDVQKAVNLERANEDFNLYYRTWEGFAGGRDDMSLRRLVWNSDDDPLYRTAFEIRSGVDPLRYYYCALALRQRGRLTEAQAMANRAGALGLPVQLRELLKSSLQ